jgi:DNA-binding transcriptional regulator LsrR (DeoR family)
MVIKLYYIDNKDQKDIAKLTGISQAKVSRLLLEAREKGMVEIKVNDYSPRNQSLEKELVEKYGLSEAAVIKTIKNPHKILHYKNIGYFAAPIVDRMVRANSLICVAAGRHIAYIVEEMRKRPLSGVSVLQTMGSVGPTANEYDAVEIGRKLAAVYNGRFYQLQTPAITSNPQEKDVFVRHSQIKSVLAMMGKATLAIIGVGVPEDSVFLDGHFLKLQDIAELKKKGVVGEICGRFYDENGNECDTHFKDCVIGMSLEQLKDVPVVIAITSGINRVPAIKAGIKGGYIKVLITDNETAEELLK